MVDNDRVEAKHQRVPLEGLGDQESTGDFDILNSIDMDNRLTATKTTNKQTKKNTQV